MFFYYHTKQAKLILKINIFYTTLLFMAIFSCFKIYNWSTVIVGQFKGKPLVDLFIFRIVLNLIDLGVLC